jgi:hypothetical protein
MHRCTLGVLLAANLAGCSSKQDVLCATPNPDDHKATPHYFVFFDDGDGTSHDGEIRYGACPPGAKGYCASDSDCAVDADRHCIAGWSSCGYVYPASCAGTVTCTEPKPTCPAGQVPLISTSRYDGYACYTGACSPTDQCTSRPPCANINDEANCIARRCIAVYNGINCHRPDGSVCHSGDTNCTCQSFEFAKCSS